MFFSKSFIVSGQAFRSLTHFELIFVYGVAAAAAAKSLQSCPTLCNPKDDSPPGSAVPGILQARVLEWVAISFSITFYYSQSITNLMTEHVKVSSNRSLLPPCILLYLQTWA